MYRKAFKYVGKATTAAHANCKWIQMYGETVIAHELCIGNLMYIICTYLKYYFCIKSVNETLMHKWTT